MNLSKHINNQKGASAIEFAIVLPLFIVLTFGIIEFGIIMYDKAMITNASREGARFCILFNTNYTDVDVSNRVNDYLNDGGMLINLGGGAPASVDVNVDPSYDGTGTNPRTSDISITVEVEYTYNFLLLPDFLNAFFGGLIPRDIDLNGVTTMRME